MENEDPNQKLIEILSTQEWMGNSITKKFIDEVKSRYEETVLRAIQARKSGEDEKALGLLSESGAILSLKNLLAEKENK
tara:strand:+ start:122 stop:358 length:237 start_codon:yes stop_codon:yes gene_type:complete